MTFSKGYLFMYGKRRNRDNGSYTFLTIFEVRFYNKLKYLYHVQEYLGTEFFYNIKCIKAEVK